MKIDRRKRLSHLNDGDFEFFAEHFVELGPVVGVGQGEFHEGFEVAGEVAYVVAALFGRQLDGVDAEAGGTHALDRVSQLDFAALIGFDAADFVEDARREDVASGDGEAAGSLFGARLFDEVGDADGVLFIIGGGDDAVLAGFGERDFFHSDDAGGGVLFKDLDHARDGFGLGVQAEDGIAEGDDEGLISGEVLPGEDGVAEAAGRALTGEEKFRGGRGFVGAEIEVILNGGFVASGDEEDLFESVGGELIDDVFDDGLAGDGQHFLGLRAGGGKQTGAESGNGYNSASDH